MATAQSVGTEWKINPVAFKGVYLPRPAAESPTVDRFVIDLNQRITA